MSRSRSRGSIEVGKLLCVQEIDSTHIYDVKNSYNPGQLPHRPWFPTGFSRGQEGAERQSAREEMYRNEFGWEVCEFILYQGL